MTPPRKPTDRSHIHRAEDIYAPGEGDLQSIGEAGLGGGAEQTVSLLGPIHIAFDTPGITAYPGISCFELEPGQMVIKAVAVSTVGWTADTGLLLHIIHPEDGSEANDDLSKYVLPISPYDASTGFVIEQYQELQSGKTHIRSAFVTLADTWIAAWIYTGSPSTGEADIYALIATPSV